MAVERDKVFQAAQKLVERKRYDKAIAEYQKLVAEDPKDVRTLLKIGDLYLKLEQYVEAITTYETVGQFYSQQGFALKAIAVYKQIREIVNKHVPHLADRFGHIVPQLAELYVQAGHTSDALAAYDEVATRLLKSKRERDAVSILEKVIELDTQNPLPQLRLAETYVKLKEVDNAITRFGAAANILVKLGRLHEALKVVERLLQYRPDVTFARMAAEIYLDRGEPNDAMSALTKLQVCFKEDPKDLDTLGLLARAFDALNQPAKALEVLKEAARVAKDSGKAELFNSLVDTLQERAPNDDVVRALATQRMTVVPPPSSATPDTDIEVEESDEDIEAISQAEAAEEVVIDEETEPEPASESAPESEPAEEAEAEPEPEPEEEEAEAEPEEEAEPEPEEEEAELEAEPDPEGLPESAPSSAPFQLTHHAPHFAPIDPIVQAKQMLAHAEVLRLRKDFDGAIDYLQSCIAALPDARDLREKLYDVLIEAGDQQGAIEEMLLYAQYLSDRNDTQGAALILDEILLLQPGQPEATQMLAQLGYALTYGTDQPDQMYTDEYGQPYGAPYGEQPQYSDPYYSPQGSYDFNDQGYAPAPHGESHVVPSRTYTGRRHEPLTSDAPLPNFPMEEESTQFMEAPPSTRGGIIVPPLGPLPDPSGAPSTAARPGVASSARRVQPPVASPSAPSRGVPTFSQFDEDALEEVEFFGRHGMFDEARAMLDEQLQRLPNHPLLLEKKRELDAMAARALSDRESGTRALPRSMEGRPSGEMGFDISESLNALDALEIEPSSYQATPQPETQQVDVESMFEQFKAGVTAQISESDAATHYDLGVAYKEMGLFTDAIAEFELASRDPGRECVCLSMIGMIYLQLSEVDAAIDAFIRGLQVRNKTKEQEYALTYEVANAYEVQGLPEQALMFFQRLAAINPTYQDPRGSVTDRMRTLDPSHKHAGRAAVGAERIRPTDDLDSAFDDMLGSSGGRKQ